MAIGSDIPRVDGVSKLTGAAAFVDDLRIDGLWHGATIGSPVARGKITGIHFDPSIDWDEFVIVDHRDVAGPNEILFIEKEQPALAVAEVRHRNEQVLLIAHRSVAALRRARQAIRVDVEPLPAIFDPRDPLAQELIQYGGDNVFKRIDVRKGEPQPIFGSAAHIIEGEYQTGSQEHVYLETQGMVVHPQDGRLVVRGSMQCPFYVLKSLMHFFGRPADAFQVVQTPIGGGFGGKEDYPSILAIHAAMLAEKAGAPVKIVYDRCEDMAVTTKRHPSWVRHRTAVDDAGRLLAMEIDVLLDGGAYVTLSPVVLSRGVIHAAGPYNCDHVHIHGEVRLTNTPPNGAFRGFGAPQTHFAMERHMDAIAGRLGLDPVELRRTNLLRPGQSTATGQVMRDTVDLPALMDRALEHAHYSQRKTQFKIDNQTHAYIRRGIGLATFHHGAGFTGSGETVLGSEVWVEGQPDGRFTVLTANTDMGQGTNTILTQIAAGALGVDVDQVSIATPDTSRVPNSGPTVASRTAMVVGRLIERACADLADRAGAKGVEGTALQDAVRDWHSSHAGQRLLGKARHRTPPGLHWDEENYRGDAYAAYAWAAYVASVEVDLRTYIVRVTDFVASQEVGKVVHPTLARGQIQGGVAQAIGWALTEEVVTQDGAMANSQMTNYIIPASGDLPPIRVFFEEQPCDFGPGGAKGIGELPMDGPAPAIINAVCDALGIAINTIPLTPERLMTILDGAEIVRSAPPKEPRASARADSQTEKDHQ